VIAKWELIDAQRAFHLILLMCVWAQVSRSGFYDWLAGWSGLGDRGAAA
jgi:Na+/H+ antiporter NhaD/arsenite permease-like protein